MIVADGLGLVVVWVAIVLVADGVVLVAVAVALFVFVADVVGTWVVVSLAPNTESSVGFDGPKGVLTSGFERLSASAVGFDCSTMAGGVNCTVGVEMTAILSNG